MLQTLWFFIKISFIVFVLLWISFQTGSVSFDLLDYHVETQLGVFLLALIVAFFVIYFVFWFVRTIFSVPKAIVDHQEKSKYKRGYQALTKGLVAVAVGDARKATKYSKQANSCMDEEDGLPVLLEAQAARLRGDEKAAQKCFSILAKNKETAFLGIRGLLKSSLDNGNYVKALEHVRVARAMQPHQDWVVKTAYDLEIKNRLWDHALRTLKKAVAINVVTNDKAQSDRIAIYIESADRAMDRGDDSAALSYLKKASRVHNAFVPTITRLAEFYIHKNNRSKAASYILKGWKEQSHPDLEKLWYELAPVISEKNRTKYLRWYEKLLAAIRKILMV